MSYHVTKLDRRHAWHHTFKWMLEFRRSTTLSSSVLEFDRSRRWFTENFGWSTDVETQQEMLSNQQKNPSSYEPTDINPVWAYSIKYNDYRIYVCGEAELNWYVLSHLNHV